MNTEEQNKQNHDSDTADLPASEADAPLPDLPPSLADAPQDADDELADDLPLQPASAVTATPEDADPVPPAPTNGDYVLLGSDLDIDAALAAVATLSMSDGVAEREAQADARAHGARPTEQPVFLLPTPPAVTMKRGTPASLVPALILIVTGGLLTLATTSGAEVPTSLIAFGALGAVALLMLGYWLTAGRWARGAFFLATLLLLSAAALYWLAADPRSPGAAGLPIFIVTTGAALILTALISRPRSRRALLPGFLMIAGGVVGLGFTLGIFDAAFLALAAQYAWVVPVFLLVLWLLPLLFRRRA